MVTQSTIQGNQNIVIQGVNNSTITLSVNGENEQIANRLDELKQLMERLQAGSFKAGDNIYFIEDINEDNFHMTTGRRPYNSMLVKSLLEMTREKPEVGSFLNSLPEEVRDSLELESVNLQDAQRCLEGSFVWVLAWELRRLFAIGNDSKRPPEEKVGDYIQHCFSCYRMTLQMANFLLVSALWDHKKTRPDLPTNIPELRLFFGEIRQTHKQLRQLFKALVTFFDSHGLAFPLPEAFTPDKIRAYTDPDGDFHQAGGQLERLIGMSGFSYRLGHCHTAECSLAKVLMAFPFFTTHQLVTIRRVEYEEMRNTKPRYIKDYTILERKDDTTPRRILRFDDRPTISYALFFHSPDNAANLFPFLVDYNALINEQEYQIYLYEYRKTKRGLCYWNVKKEGEEQVLFSAANDERIEVDKEETKREHEKNIRIDLAIKQFADAMNTLLECNAEFQKEVAREYPNI